MNTATSEFEDIVETTHIEEEYDVVDNNSKIPSEYDPEWSEYLLDQLSDSELINGAPTVDGLRRITEKCFGEIVCVDVLYHKTPYPFKDHLVATADTRAEGKALRRALKIRVITAEELQNEDEQEALSSDELVNDQQVLALNQLCKRLDLSVTSFVKGEYNKIKKINELRNLEARLLIAKLSEFQRTPKDIPDSYMGYDENWKGDFYGSSK